MALFKEIPGFKNFKHKGYEISFMLEYFDQINPYIKVILKKYDKAIALKYPISNKVNLDIYSDLVSNIYAIIDFIEIMATKESQKKIEESIKILETPCNYYSDEDIKPEKKQSIQEHEKNESSDLMSWFNNVDTSRYLHDLEKEKEEK